MRFRTRMISNCCNEKISRELSSHLLFARQLDVILKKDSSPRGVHRFIAVTHGPTRREDTHVFWRFKEIAQASACNFSIWEGIYQEVVTLLSLLHQYSPPP